MGKGKGKEVVKEAEDYIEEEIEDDIEEEVQGDINTLLRRGAFRPGGTFIRNDFLQTNEQLQYHEEELTHPRQIAKDKASPR